MENSKAAEETIEDLADALNNLYEKLAIIWGKRYCTKAAIECSSFFDDLSDKTYLCFNRRDHGWAFSIQTKNDVISINSASLEIRIGMIDALPDLEKMLIAKSQKRQSELRQAIIKLSTFIEKSIFIENKTTTK